MGANFEGAKFKKVEKENDVRRIWSTLWKKGNQKIKWLEVQTGIKKDSVTAFHPPGNKKIPLLNYNLSLVQKYLPYLCASP